MEVDVHAICGEDMISRDAGKKVRDFLLGNWGEEKLQILVRGKVIASVSFFDEAFGLLMKKGGKTWAEVRAKLDFPDLIPEDRGLLNSVIRTRLEEIEKNNYRQHK
jgi:hypothetical protein